uniref:Polycystin cation channel PKD1/PKD2 domain-containing protein n=1 Tax=Eutreptiella gymnastica TaxID=73025 RepID=A0A7S1NJS0_9EUGL
MTVEERRAYRKAKRLGIQLEKEEKEEKKEVQKLDPTTLQFTIQPVRAIFTPSQRVDMEKRVTAMKFLKEVLKYGLFLIIFTYVTIANRPSWAFECAQAMELTVFTNFSTADSLPNVYKYLETYAFPTLFPYTDPSSGKILPQELDNMVLGSNRLIGPVRLRTIRIQPNADCYITPRLKGLVKRCIPKEFSSDFESKDPIMIPELTLATPSNSNITNATLAGVSNLTAHAASQNLVAAGHNLTMPSGHKEYNVVWRPRWKWADGKQLCNTTSEIISKYCITIDLGHTGIQYPSSGFVMDFPPAKYFTALDAWKTNKAALMAQNITTFPPPPSKLQYSLELLTEAKKHLWMDKQTVYTCMEFSTYNAAVRVLTGVRATFEFFPSGEVKTKISRHAVSLGSLSSIRDKLSLIGDLLILLAVIAYMYEYILRVRSYFTQSLRSCMQCAVTEIERLGLTTLIVCPNCQNPFDVFKVKFCPECYKDLPVKHTCWRGYFQDLWNFLDLINLVVFIVVLSFRFIVRIDATRLDLAATVTEDTFINLYPLAWYMGFMAYWNSFNMLLCFIKTLKYLGRVKSLAVLLKTLTYSFNDLVKFLVIFFVVLLAYALAFGSAYGSDLYDYRDTSTSVTTMIRSLLGQFDYHAMERSNKMLAVLLFLSFQVLTTLIMVNMFIAILDAAHVKANKENKANKLDFLNSSLWMLIRQWRRRCGCGKDDLVTNALKVLYAIEDIPALRKAERDDARRFRKLMTDNPDNDLLVAILKHFEDRDTTQEWVYEDYEIVVTTVCNHRAAIENGSRRAGGVWEDDMEEIGQSSVTGLTGKHATAREIAKVWAQDRKLMVKLVEVKEQLNATSEVIDELNPKISQWLQSKPKMVNPQSHMNECARLRQEFLAEWGTLSGVSATAKSSSKSMRSVLGGLGFNVNSWDGSKKLNFNTLQKLVPKEDGPVRPQGDQSAPPDGKTRDIDSDYGEEMILTESHKDFIHVGDHPRPRRQSVKFTTGSPPKPQPVPEPSVHSRLQPTQSAPGPAVMALQNAGAPIRAQSDRTGPPGAGLVMTANPTVNMAYTGGAPHDHVDTVILHPCMPPPLPPRPQQAMAQPGAPAVPKPQQWSSGRAPAPQTSAYALPVQTQATPARQRQLANTTHHDSQRNPYSTTGVGYSPANNFVPSESSGSSSQRSRPTAQEIQVAKALLQRNLAIMGSGSGAPPKPRPPPGPQGY